MDAEILGDLGSYSNKMNKYHFVVFSPKAFLKDVSEDASEALKQKGSGMKELVTIFSEVTSSENAQLHLTSPASMLI